MLIIVRNAFFAGAQHLYQSIMRVLDEGTEPTMADLQRMAAIDAELEAFIAEFSRKHGLGGQG